jgi:hypothetical protein
LPAQSSDFRDWRSELINSQGKKLVPWDCERVMPLGNGLYFLSGTCEGAEKQTVPKNVFVTSAGQEAPGVLPPGCKIVKIYLENRIFYGSEKAIDHFTDPDILALQNGFPLRCIFGIRGPEGAGLCWPNGKIILPPQYHQIGPPRRGLFPVFARGDNSNPIQFAYDVEARASILDRHILNGLADINFGYPPLKTDANTQSPAGLSAPNKFKTAAKLVNSKTTENLTICVVEPSVSSFPRPVSDFVFFNNDGKEVFKASGYSEICYKHGLAVLGKLGLCGDYTYLVVDEHGLVGGPIYGNALSIVDPNLLVRYWRNPHFDKSKWDSRSYLSALDQFSNFLADYNLIGMPREQVVSLLGQGNQVLLSSDGHTKSGSWIELEYENGKVKMWRQVNRVYNETSPAPWNTADMLLDTGSSERIGTSKAELVPKIKQIP